MNIIPRRGWSPSSKSLRMLASILFGGNVSATEHTMSRKSRRARRTRISRSRQAEALEPRLALTSTWTVNHPPYLQLGDAPSIGEPGSEQDQVEIVWQTLSSGAGDDAFRVLYRQLGSGLWELADDPQLIDTGVATRQNHHVTLKDLFYDTDYEYRVEHLRNAQIVTAYQQTFHTRLFAGTPEAFSFVAYGDSAYDNPPANFVSVQQRINQLNPAFTILTGDNAYGDDTDPSSAWGSHAAQDLRFDPSLNAATPAFIGQHIEYPTLGNADLATNGGQASRDNYSLPLNGPIDSAASGDYFSSRLEHNYSFDYGNVHFATFDSSSYFGPEASVQRLQEQLTWLVSDMTASHATWKVVYTHYPILASDGNKTADDPYYQQVITALRTAGVNLLLVGDSHTYQRSYPLTGYEGDQAIFVADTDNTYDADAGLVQVVIGTGGRGLNPGSFGSVAYLARAFSSTTSPASEYGVAKVDVVGNQLTVRYIAADDGATLDTFTLRAAAPQTIDAQSLPVGETIWRASDGPRHITGNVVVPVGATLKIEPGVNLSFAAAGGLEVRGRLVAEGTPYRRISMSAPSGSTTQWNGIKFVNTLEDNRLVYLDLSDGMARSNGILMQKSRVTIDHVFFNDINGNILQLQEVDLTVTNSQFPNVNRGEPIESMQGMASFGQIVIANNVFGQTTGGNDTIDIQGGQRVGRMLQVIDNVFFGGPDEALDLDVDAHIEGNLFMNNRAALAAPRGDGITSSISTGYTSAPGVGRTPAVLTVTRNVFYNVDHTMGLKDQTFVHFTQNTVINAGFDAISFYDPSRKTPAAAGARVEGNIFARTSVPFGHVDESPSGPIDTDLVMNDSLLDGVPSNQQAALLALGVGNLHADPRFVDPSRDFRLADDSPAKRSGPDGRDMGAFVENVAPEMEQVTVRGSQWSQAIIDELIAQGYTAEGYSFNGTQGGHVPWAGVDQIRMRFSEGVVIPRDGLIVRRADGTAIPITSFSFDTIKAVALWTLAAPVDEGIVELSLSSSVVDYAGRSLSNDGAPIITSFSVGLTNPCDLNGDLACTAKDIDDLVLALGTADPRFDLDKNGTVALVDHGIWVEQYQHTWYGDANLDGQFTSADLVLVFQRGAYESPLTVVVGWSDGDWNGDGQFSSSDLVRAFQDGGYESGPRPAKKALSAMDAAFADDSLLGLNWLRD